MTNARTSRIQRAEKIKKLELEQRSKDRRRKRLILISAAAVTAVCIGAVVLVLTLNHSHPSSSVSGPQIVPNAPTGAGTTQPPATPVTAPSGITGLLAWDTQGWPGDGASHAGALGHDHVTGPVTYSVIPPVGGPHNPVWMNAGIYTVPIPSERAVHNLEHGAVWITYQPGLSASKIAILDQLVAKQSLISEPSQAAGQLNQANRYVDMSPWADDQLPSPIVISSWGYQLRVTDPSDPRLQQFIDMFRHSSKYSPEFGGAVDGVPVQTGGRPAADGGSQPNPAGSAG